MSYRKTVLAQILGGLEVVEFARCVARPGTPNSIRIRC